MQTSDEALEEFISLYKEAFGETITLAEAREMARRLVHLYKILLRPLPGERRGQDGSNGTHTTAER